MAVTPEKNRVNKQLIKCKQTAVTFKTMNPFFPLGSLTTYIKHFEMQAFVSELGFNYTRGFDSGSEYILQKSKQIFVNKQLSCGLLK